MMLIADSGSTKCDWQLVNEDNSRQSFLTMGFNPFFHSTDFIINELKKELVPKLPDSVFQVPFSIYFYGAGCSSKERNEQIKNSIQSVFPKADILVDHDLLASAYALYEGEPFIACILGTGSNSCFFDGKKVSEEIPALGYLLGDEGSGSYYGKILLKKFLYKQLPGKINATLEKEYNLNKEIIFDHVYNKPGANVYLASFFRVLTKHKEEEFVRNIVKAGLSDFMENHIYCFRNFKEVKSNFVGSVAFFFEDLLRETATGMGIQVSKVIRQPINSLVDYHLKYVL